MKHRVTTYAELNKWSNAFVNGAFGLVLLIGKPGLAKTWTIENLVREYQEKAKKKKLSEANKAGSRGKGRKTLILTPPAKTPPLPRTHVDFLPEGHIAAPLWVVGGAVSAFQLYQELWWHKNQLCVLDDVDSASSDRTIVRLLKALCQTEKEKTVGWYTANRQLDGLDIPHKFTTRSRVVIIANEWKSLTEHVGSLESRGVMIDFDPPIEEVFRYVKENRIIQDKEILDFMGKHLWMVQRIDIRDFKNIADAKKAKLDWKTALTQSLGIRDMLVVEELMKDKSFPTDEARAMKFMKITKQSRPKWFDAKKQLAEIKGQGKKTLAGLMA